MLYDGGDVFYRELWDVSRIDTRPSGYRSRRSSKEALAHLRRRADASDHPHNFEQIAARLCRFARLT